MSRVSGVARWTSRLYSTTVCDLFQGDDEVGSLKLVLTSLSSKIVAIGKSVAAFNQAVMERLSQDN